MAGKKYYAVAKEFLAAVFDGNLERARVLHEQAGEAAEDHEQGELGGLGILLGFLEYGAEVNPEPEGVRVRFSNRQEMMLTDAQYRGHTKGGEANQG